jgi:hypothetical protein
MPHLPGADACVLRGEEALAHRLGAALAVHPECGVADADLAAHLVVQTAEALAHRFVLHGIHGMPEARFAGEVEGLLIAYLQAGRAPRTARR